VERREITLLKT